MVVSHPAHSSLTRRQLRLTALKLHVICTSRNPHSLALALLVRAVDSLAIQSRQRERPLDSPQH